MSKFNKKKFKGLDSIFENENSFQDEQTIVADKEIESKGKKVDRIKAKGNNKNFTFDLDTLLEQALHESEDIVEENKRRNTNAKKGETPTVSGLDALIRQTINFDTSKSNSKDKKPTKRVTFTVDKEKLTRLKQIARTENSYLKDIIAKLIADYISEYETQKS